MKCEEKSFCSEHTEMWIIMRRAFDIKKRYFPFRICFSLSLLPCLCTLAGVWRRVQQVVHTSPSPIDVRGFVCCTWKAINKEILATRCTQAQPARITRKGKRNLHDLSINFSCWLWVWSVILMAQRQAHFRAHYSGCFFANSSWKSRRAE